VPSTQVIGYSCPSSHNIVFKLIDSTVRCPRDFSAACQGKWRVKDVVGLHPGLTAQHFVKANGITDQVAVEAHRLLVFVDKSRRTSYFVVEPRHNENASEFRASGAQHHRCPEAAAPQSTLPVVHRR
jgi:hypothetical protein